MFDGLRLSSPVVFTWAAKIAAIGKWGLLLVPLVVVPVAGLYVYARHQVNERASAEKLVERLQENVLTLTHSLERVSQYNEDQALEREKYDKTIQTLERDKSTVLDHPVPESVSELLRSTGRPDE